MIKDLDDDDDLFPDWTTPKNEEQENYIMERFWIDVERKHWRKDKIMKIYE